MELSKDMSKPEISIIDCELMKRSEEADYKASCYLLEHGDEFDKMTDEEQMRKLAEVMFGVK